MAYLDDKLKPLVLDNMNLSVPHYLCATHLYYERDVSAISDGYYDWLGRFLKRNWDEIEHWHKPMLRYNNLTSGGSYLVGINWPTRIVSAAERLARRAKQPLNNDAKFYTTLDPKVERPILRPKLRLRK